MANITWDRGLGYAIERPKSVTTPMLEQWAADGGRKMAAPKETTIERVVAQAVAIAKLANSASD
jgi:DNA-binding transcriptional regulator YdaS (Cro superfamily)